MESSFNSPHVNVATRLVEMAGRFPDQMAITMSWGKPSNGVRQYRTISFREMDQDSDRIARGLHDMGVLPGTRLALLVPPSIEFITLVFALLKAGVVIVLIDPGMGKKNLIRCLREVEPEGFVAIPLVHALRKLLPGSFPKARFHVTVGKRWFWGGKTLDDFLTQPWQGTQVASTRADDPAAIIFTTGSTGPPKGVLYSHGNFDRQVTEIRDAYDIRPGEIDLPGFPLFGLFNAAMGVSTVLPDMDPTRPAKVRPTRIIAAVKDWKVTQAFGSPAMWNRVGEYCTRKQIRLDGVKRILSSGAPVSPRVLQWVRDSIDPKGEMYTPYGATEALPVATISATEVLTETAEQSRLGKGTCVGRRFGGIEWKVIRAVDGPISEIALAEKLPSGEVGELIVSGPVVTRQYVTRTEWNARAKISDGEKFWHRMGDVGYLDERDRFWFCGRMAHRVLTCKGPLYTIPCEAIFNEHAAVFRSALVGVGPVGEQRPVIVVEPWPDYWPRNRLARKWLADDLRELAKKHPHTLGIEDFLVYRSFPVDIRHNAKIFREKLAVWAERELARNKK